MEKIIIVGLGNPGKKYKNTPHNAGFETIDEMVSIIREGGYSVGESSTKEYIEYDIPMDGKRVIMIKPLTYMNRSGEVLKSVLKNHEVSLEKNLWVIYDDIDIPIGALRIKKGGGAAGHKGVKNIIDHIKIKDFYRLRIGVKTKYLPEKRSPDLTGDFVTKKLKGTDKKTLQKIKATCSELLLKAIELGEIEMLTGDYSIE